MTKKKTDAFEHSKFWLDDNFDGKDLSKDLFLLAAYRRSIANFVMILTGKDVPVKFAEKSNSFTDGKSVTIGGEITNGQIDATVGLALHEGSHIVKSDFSMLHNLWQMVPQKVYDVNDGKLTKNAIVGFTKTMLNYVEDRYIDAWSYKRTPGYRGYYLALYDRYFNNEEITFGLKSDSFRELNLRNYRFRIINLTNPEAPLDAMPKLLEIYRLLDLPNILRLNEPRQRFDLATEIVTLVLSEIIKENEEKKQKESKSNGSGKSDKSETEKEGPEDKEIELAAPKKEPPKEESKETPKEEEKKEEEKSDVGGDKKEEEKPEEKPEEKAEQANVAKEEDPTIEQKKLAGETPEQPTEEVSQEDIKEIEKQIQEQVDFTDRDLKQKGFTDAVIDRLETLESSEIDIVPVGGEGPIPLLDCIVVKNMTKKLMADPSFPYSSKMSFAKNVNEEAVLAGTKLGAMLGRRLQIRNDSRTTHFTRLQRGRIEKRLISELGFGSDRIFYQTSTDQFKKAHLHVSVDASSSMDTKWKRTMTTLVAIAKAASMVKNLSITISFRSGIKVSDEETPYIVIAYDSRRDKFSKITQLFPSLLPHGSTPEGLAFQAILKLIPPSTPDLDSFFVNLSDGEPYFSSAKYHGHNAWEHTRKQIEKVRASGIEVMSYFLEEKVDEVSLRAKTNEIAFRRMYGRDALIIDVDSVAQIAHSMNRKFLMKPE